MWASLIPWPYRLLAYSAALVAFGATCWIYGARHEQAMQQAEQIDHLQSVIRTERRSVQRMADIDTRHTQEQSHAKRKAEALIAGLRTGTVRVRQQLAASSVPVIATSSGQCDAAPQPGLQPADAEFLLRLAAEADDITRQLMACQAVIDADRVELGKP